MDLGKRLGNGVASVTGRLHQSLISLVAPLARHGSGWASSPVSVEGSTTGCLHLHQLRRDSARLSPVMEVKKMKTGHLAVFARRWECGRWTDCSVMVRLRTPRFSTFSAKGGEKTGQHNLSISPCALTFEVLQRRCRGILEKAFWRRCSKPLSKFWRRRIDSELRAENGELVKRVSGLTVQLCSVWVNESLTRARANHLVFWLSFAVAVIVILACK